MPLTEKESKIVDYMVDTILKPKQQDLGVADVFYGDQTMLPRTPALAVEPGPISKDYVGSSSQMRNTFTVFVLCYFGRIQDVQVNQREALLLAENVADLLTADPRLGDIGADTNLVTFGRVVAIDPGLAVRGGALLRTSRITWEGWSDTLMGATA